MVAHESKTEVQRMKISRKREGEPMVTKFLVFFFFYLDSGELGGGGVIFTEESVLDSWVSSSSKRKLILW